MSENQYENFKSGLKSDINGIAWGLFAGIGLFLLAFTLGSILIWVYLKTNHYPVEIKATTTLLIIVLVASMLLNKQIGNYIYLLWLKLLLIIALLICASILCFFVYCTWYLLKDNF